MALVSLTADKKDSEGLTHISEKIVEEGLKKNLSDINDIIGYGRAQGIAVSVRGCDVESAMTVGPAQDLATEIKASLLFTIPVKEDGTAVATIGHYATKTKTGGGRSKNSITLGGDVSMQLYYGATAGSVILRDWVMEDGGSGMMNMTVHPNDPRTIYNELQRIGSLGNVVNIRESCTGQWLARLSEGEDYTVLFFKMILLANASSCAYATKDKVDVGVVKDASSKIIPMEFQRMFVEYHTKLGDCIVNTDLLTPDEVSVLANSAQAWPNVMYTKGKMRNVYCAIEVPATPVTMITYCKRILSIEAPCWGPEKIWSCIYGLAEKLGAVGDLIDAYRMLLGLVPLAVKNHMFTGEPGVYTISAAMPRGVRSLFSNSVALHRTVRIEKQTNLMAMTGWLVADALIGQEMFNAYFYVAEYLGTANPYIVDGDWEDDTAASQVQSMLYEAGIMNNGASDLMKKSWKFFSRHPKPPSCQLQNLATVTGLSMAMFTSTHDEKADQKARSMAIALLDSTVNLLATPFFKAPSPGCSTRMVGKELVIDPEGLGAKATSATPVMDNLSWLTLHGANERHWNVGGLSSAGLGMPYVNSTLFKKMQHCFGSYKVEFSDITIPGFEARTGRYSRSCMGLYRDKPYITKGPMGMRGDPISRVSQKISEVDLHSQKTGPAMSAATSGMSRRTPGGKITDEAKKDAVEWEEPSSKTDEPIKSTGAGASYDKFMKKSDSAYQPLGTVAHVLSRVAGKKNIWVNVIGDGFCAAHAIAGEAKRLGLEGITYDTIANDLRAYDSEFMVSSGTGRDYSVEAVKRWFAERDIPLCLFTSTPGANAHVTSGNEKSCAFIAHHSNHYYHYGEGFLDAARLHALKELKTSLPRVAPERFMETTGELATGQRADGLNQRDVYAAAAALKIGRDFSTVDFVDRKSIMAAISRGEVTVDLLPPDYKISDETFTLGEGHHLPN